MVSGPLTPWEMVGRLTAPRIVESEVGLFATEGAVSCVALSLSRTPSRNEARESREHIEPCREEDDCMPGTAVMVDRLGVGKEDGGLWN